MWVCQCDCGNTIICSGSDLRTGKRTSCGKHCNSVIDETGNIYGSLEVVERDPTPARQFADNSIHWICKCHNCGSIKSVSGKLLRNGDAKSCGCIKSAGEVMIESILTELGYPHIKEYTFSDLISPFSQLKLRFDFGIKDENGMLKFLIEYQGQQHEQQVEYFGSKLERIQACDECKRQYCMQHDVPLLIITHINGKLPNREDTMALIKSTMEELT